MMRLLLLVALLAPMSAGGSSPTTNCSRFHTIVTDDTCWNLADPAKGYGYGLSPGNAGVNELLAMNPGLICDDPVNNPLQIGQRVCVTAGSAEPPASSGDPPAYEMFRKKSEPCIVPSDAKTLGAHSVQGCAADPDKLLQACELTSKQTCADERMLEKEEYIVPESVFLGPETDSSGGGNAELNLQFESAMSATAELGFTSKVGTTVGAGLDVEVLEILNAKLSGEIRYDTDTATKCTNTNSQKQVRQVTFRNITSCTGAYGYMRGWQSEFDIIMQVTSTPKKGGGPCPIVPLMKANGMESVTSWFPPGKGPCDDTILIKVSGRGNSSGAATFRIETYPCADASKVASFSAEHRLCTSCSLGTVPSAGAVAATGAPIVSQDGKAGRQAVDVRVVMPANKLVVQCGAPQKTSGSHTTQPPANAMSTVIMMGGLMLLQLMAW